MWIFGYGSLIWRPDFAFEESRIAVLMGWRRAFTQGSPDHRGTPRAPGRDIDCPMRGTGRPVRGTGRPVRGNRWSVWCTSPRERKQQIFVISLD